MASFLHGLVYFFTVINCPCIDGVSGPGQHAQAGHCPFLDDYFSTGAVQSLEVYLYLH